MKTAGELLKEKRLTMELDLATVAAKTKIKENYLQAIEESDYDNLPSGTFAKGFLRSYANFLHLNGDTIVAMFRRDTTENEKGEIIPRGLVEPVGAKKKFLTVNLILAAIGILAFLGFLIFQLTSWWSLPKLELFQPQNGAAYGEKVTVKGIAAPDATISINGQKVILDQSGSFSLDLVFSAGTQSVLVTATNRQGKTHSLDRTFTVSK
jgi:cytoskeletal protein RodZ